MNKNIVIGLIVGILVLGGVMVASNQSGNNPSKDAVIESEAMNGNPSDDAVSYTHLTLPTTERV